MMDFLKISIPQWKFLQRDEGEENVSTDQLWTKDEGEYLVYERSRCKKISRMNGYT